MIDVNREPNHNDETTSAQLITYILSLTRKCECCKVLPNNANIR